MVLGIDCLCGTVHDRCLFTDLTLALPASNIYAITGPSGCGKTTFLRMVAGLMSPTAGTCRLETRLPQEWGIPAYRRQVMLAQQAPVFFDTSVESNLRRPFTYKTVDAQFERDEAVNLLEQVGLPASILEQPALSLSQGQQQRINLIRVLLLRPKVLLLDEPTSALDEETRFSVETLLTQVTKTSPTAAFVVTHDRTQAQRLGHREIDLSIYQPKAGKHDG